MGGFEIPGLGCVIDRPEPTPTQTIYRNSVNNSMSQASEYIARNSAKTASSVYAVQTAELFIGGDMGPNCDITQSQRINMTQQTSGVLDANQVQDLATIFSTNINNGIDQAATASSEFLAQAISAGTTTELQTNISRVISSAVTFDNYNEVLSQTFTNQGAKITVGGSCNGKIVQDQYLVANVIAVNLMNVVQNALLSDTSTTDVITRLSQTSKSKSTGLAGLIKSIFDGIHDAFTGPWATIAIACVVLACVMCLGLLAFALSPAGQESTKTAVSAGANIAKARYG